MLAVLSAAAGSGLLVSNAAAQVKGRRSGDDDDGDPELLVSLPKVQPPELLAHRSHSSHASHGSSSHSSHQSHVSGSGGGWGGGGVDVPAPSPAPEPAPSPYVPPPAPPKPAVVRFVAFPGGRISVDGVLLGTDLTGPVTLKPQAHDIRIENRFLGEHRASISLAEGQTGLVTVDW